MKRQRTACPRRGEVWGNTYGMLVRVLSVEHRAGWGDVVRFRFVEEMDEDVRNGADRVGLFLRDYWRSGSMT